MKHIDNTDFKKNNLAIYLPHMFVAIWLGYLGIMIWQRAFTSNQPPYYDPLGYIQKAMNFWQLLEGGKLFNPFNIEPNVRPPGTILMSYPFGFSPDFHGFHFRSVFLPILCVVSAVYIAAGKVQARTFSWGVAAIAFLFSSLPMFFCFEGGQGTLQWGLVDNFQAGVAAIAAAAVARSLLTRSLLMLFLGVFSAAFTLLIKPSGLMVMALIALVWFIVVAAEWVQRGKHKSPDTGLRSYAFKGSILLSCVYIGVCSVCFWSKYMSVTNFSYAKKALVVAREVLRIDFKQAISLFHYVSGEAFPIWTVAIILLFVSWLHVIRSENVRIPHQVGHPFRLKSATQYD